MAIVAVVAVFCSLVLSVSRVVQFARYKAFLLEGRSDRLMPNISYQVAPLAPRE